MLTQSERDSLLDTLSEPQKEFIVHFAEIIFRIIQIYPLN
mgnify:CR=1 FL=1